MAILYTKMDIRLRVYSPGGGDVRILPVTAFNVSMAINEIPIAQVRLPLGREIGADSTKPPIDKEVRERFLGQYNRCQIVGSLSGDRTTTEKWVETPVVLFDGFVDAQGVSITRDQATFQVPLVHWLSRLESGSLLFQYANPSDARRRDDPAASYGALNVVDEAKKTGLPAAALGRLVDKNYLSKKGAEQDLWAKGWKQLVAQLLTTDLKNTSSFFGCADAVNVPSKDLIEALSRIEGESEKLGLAHSQWAKPLRISSPQAEIPLTVKESIFRLITHNAIMDAANSTAWEKMLLDMVHTLDCVIVPRINTAIVAPYLPDGIQWHRHVIRSNEIDQIASVNPIRRPLKATAASVSTRSPVQQALGRQDLITRGISCYSPTPPGDAAAAAEFAASQSSRTQFIQSPAYLAEMSPEAIQNMFAASGWKPDGGNTGPPPPSTVGTAEQRRLADHYNSMLYKYAKASYHRLQRAGQAVTVATRLRFDISPGSSVLVSARLDEFLGGPDTGELWQGYVNRVSYGVDLTTMTAATVFQMEHVRPKTSQEDSRSLESHPLFLDTFTGATLTDDFEARP